MPPGIVPIYNIWEHDEDLKKEIEVSCLLPNGMFILLKCNREETITSIKTKVWKQARTFPFFHQLLDINFYIFQCINQNAEQEELLDEKRRLCDVQPFSPDLRLVVKAGDVEDKVLNRKISYLIHKGLHEFDVMKNEEVNDFRLITSNTGVSLQRERTLWDWDQKACFLFPPQLEPSLALPEPLKRRLDDCQLVAFNVRFLDEPPKVAVLKAGLFEYPTDLVRKAIQKFHTTQDIKEEDYVMKIRGKLEYLLGNRHLFEYKYIRKVMSGSSGNERPELVLVHKGNLQVNEILMDPLLRTRSKNRDERPPPVPTRISGRKPLTWDIPDYVHVTFCRAWKVNVDSGSNLIVRVRAGIFHGGEQLGECFTSSQETHGSNPDWNERFQTDITVSNLPRMARLCLVIGVGNKNKAKKDLIPLAWVNTTFFNYKNQLQTGKRSLYMWPALEDTDLNPSGSVESNPDHFDATGIEIIFGKYSNDTLLYPPSEKIIEIGTKACQAESADPIFYQRHQNILDELRGIVEKNPLEDLEEQEKEMLWKTRQDCCEHIPHSLPRLLQCVQWDNSVFVAQMQSLLKNWPELKPEEAMELLDYKYADIAVRKFAVMCLEKLTDSDLSQYLLQLVQALKYETHLDCDLGQFLLRRALQNQRIGHFFFWHLRAEMHNPTVSTRFGLLLEAYCRCNITHMRILTKQVETLGKMKMVNELIKSKPPNTVRRDELLQMMRDVLKQEAVAEVLSKFVSPLSPSDMLKELRVDKCKFMSSKMAPLWLVFRNDDSTGDDVYIMFKNGDDLRQDMLTLQVMQIMDKIWQEEGLDLRLIPYNALATGSRSGLIEIVTGADTIANIQKKQSTRINAAFQRKSIFEWLKKKNKTPTELDKAIEDFTYSCAGYCVATYVLGIGDRHNDNIMIKETGQLFHIDFGHFLGKFKSKFGVKRERVPFVLTHDFVHVITRGNKKATKEFENFRTCCEEAFMILRRHGNLLITLFAMMLSSGIPELSDSTINYLHGSLVLEKSDEEARKHFQTKFNLALQESWKTSLNWTAHIIAHKD